MNHIKHNAVDYRLDRNSAPLLGSKLLEILSFKIVVCCHLRGVDSLFLVRAIQVIAQHATLLPIIISTAESESQSQSIHSGEIRSQSGHIYSSSTTSSNSTSNGTNNTSDSSTSSSSSLSVYDKYKKKSSLTARKCLMYLVRMNVDVIRAVRLACFLAIQDTNITVTAPPPFST